MKYFGQEIPETVYNIKECYDKYDEDKDETMFDILQMYQKEECSINMDGIYQFKHFELIGFNTKKMTWRHLGKHDEIYTVSIVRRIAIIADGSTVIEYKKPVCVRCSTQTVYI